MNRWMIWLLGTALVVGGCSSTPRSESKPVTSHPPTQQAPEAPAGAEKANPTPAPAFDEKALRQKVGEALKQKGASVTPDGPRLFPLQLQPVPQGYSRLVAAVADMKLFLVAVSDSGSLFMIGQWENVLINMAKLEITSSTDKMTVWSQKAYGATEMRAELSWNGNTLQVVKSEVSDPTSAYFGAKQKLINSKDIDGLMAYGGVKDILYPQSNPGYWSQPRQVLLLAYEAALTRYRAGDLPLALRTLEYGGANPHCQRPGLLPG